MTPRMRMQLLGDLVPRLAAALRQLDPELSHESATDHADTAAGWVGRGLEGRGLWAALEGSTRDKIGAWVVGRSGDRSTSVFPAKDAKLAHDMARALNRIQWEAIVENAPVEGQSVLQEDLLFLTHLAQEQVPPDWLTVADATNLRRVANGLDDRLVPRVDRETARGGVGDSRSKRLRGFADRLEKDRRGQDGASPS